MSTGPSPMPKKGQSILDYSIMRNKHRQKELMEKERFFKTTLSISLLFVLCMLIFRCVKG